MDKSLWKFSPIVLMSIVCWLQWYLTHSVFEGQNEAIKLIPVYLVASFCFAVLRTCALNGWKFKGSKRDLLLTPLAVVCIATFIGFNYGNTGAHL